MGTRSPLGVVLGRPYRPVTPNLGARDVPVGSARAKVHEEPFIFNSVLYAAPNEHDNRFFERAVGGHVDGAIISVGTFRGFDSSKLTDGLTFLVDEARITDINLQLLNLIRSASNRY